MLEKLQLADGRRNVLLHQGPAFAHHRFVLHHKGGPGENHQPDPHHQNRQHQPKPQRYRPFHRRPPSFFVYSSEMLFYYTAFLEG
ncbi:unnamed protein product [Pararhodospirillum photometricum DSM 122]|uniref:Uncharacterized protein n=1 Tax=Pararhodospirillum photometricum DSM 122 TaxID=1150469 RepID=H6SN58_PARPM|nr:unnamed protein product [Pararhodospirillum photometricum DSM 122]